MFNSFLDIVRISAVNGKGHLGMFLLKTGDEPGKKTGTLQFTASNGNRTGQLCPIMAEILLCLLCQSQDFFRAAPQKHSIFCQNNMVSASLKQRNSQLLLQLY